MMNETKILLLIAAVVSAFSFTPRSFAQSVVDQGKPGNKGPWPVTIVGGSGGGSGSGGGTVTGPDGGAVVVQDLFCTAPRETAFVPSTVDGGTCPVTALAGRRTILLCNAPKNSTIAAAPFFTVTIDGQIPTNSLYSPGQQLGLGDCITYTASASVPVHCISDTFDAGLLITECK